MWLPPRVAGERALGAEPSLHVMIAEATGQGVSMRRSSLETLPALRSVRLVFDARDVTLLSEKLPALAPAKLQRALPNLFEDQLLQDTNQCAWALAPGSTAEARLVGVMDRQWLDTVMEAFERRRIRVSAAWPGQALQLLRPGGGISLLCIGNGLSVITGLADSMGLSGGGDPLSRREAVRAVLALYNDRLKSGLNVFTDDEAWRDAVRECAAVWNVSPRFAPIPVPAAASIDFLAARQRGAIGRAWANFDVRAWRWPFMTALAAAGLAMAGLNVHWWELHREQSTLQARLNEAFAQVFPSGTARVDPVVQLRRHVASLKARAGQASADDFVPMISALGQALGTQAPNALAAVEYREGRLRVRFRPGLADTRAARESLEQSARRQGLRLQFESERDALASITVMR